MARKDLVSMDIGVSRTVLEREGIDVPIMRIDVLPDGGMRLWLYGGRVVDVAADPLIDDVGSPGEPESAAGLPVGGDSSVSDSPVDGVKKPRDGHSRKKPAPPRPQL